ncbi:hypothetical protein ACFYTQ_27385 [Nocardia sp. NPDC004068]|uniref:hypothetical protein n=1 Tax=Nocardia sp. NPDC004068 TaxID=3364303 RepID=UPI00367948C9
MRVDWQVYYDAAKRCQDLAEELRRADKPVHDAVKGECAGMAGDAPGCREWGVAYDDAARKTMQACSSLANALTNYGAVLYAMGFHYGEANNNKPPVPNVAQVGEYQVVIPTSVHDNGIGFTNHGGLKEYIDQVIARVLATFGKLPNGDKDKLDKAHRVWDTFGTHPTITGAAAQITTISALFDGLDDPTNRQLIQDHFATLKTSAETIATAGQSMAAPIKNYHEATVSLGSDTSRSINNLELTLGVAAVLGGAIALFSLGTSIAPAAAVVGEEVASTVAAIQTAYQESQMVRVLGMAALAATAVGTITAFTGVPSIDLDKVAKDLAAIIAMKAAIHGEGGQDGAEKHELPNVRDPKTFDPQSLTGKSAEEIANGIPSDWEEAPSKSGGGTVYRDPNNFGRQIRIMPGYTEGNRPDPLTHGPYAEVSQNGTNTKVPLQGNPTLGGPR